MTEAEPEISPQYDLSAVIIPLLRGVINQERDGSLWNALLNLHAGVRDYVLVLGLQLVLDGAKGYTLLRSRQPEGEDDGAMPKLPDNMVIFRRGYDLEKLAVADPSLAEGEGA